MPKKLTKKSKTPKKPAQKAVKKTTKAKKPQAPVAPNPPQVLAPVVVPAPQPQDKTEAEKMWDEIKNRPIDMFGLPDQFVFQHATFITIEPSSLYVTIRSSATLPSLEAAVKPDFTVELADKFVIIKRAPKPLVPSKRR